MRAHSSNRCCPGSTKRYTLMPLSPCWSRSAIDVRGGVGRLLHRSGVGAVDVLHQRIDRRTPPGRILLEPAIGTEALPCLALGMLAKEPHRFVNDRRAG